MKAVLVPALLAATALTAPAARAEESMITFRVLTPETALAAAQAAMKKCRDSGWQVAVAVVDRAGIAQVLLRDRFAGPHTPRMATGKAWTAVSFRTGTTEVARISQAGQPQSGLRHLPRVIAVGGGMPIESQGSIVAGIGVSGAPGGESDDACARAGIEAIRERIEF